MKKESLTPADTKHPFRYYVKKHAGVFAIGVATLLATNLFDVLTPLALKAGIDGITEQNQSNVFMAIGAYIALISGATLFRYLWRIYFGRFHLFVADDLRNRIFTKLTSLGPSFYSRSPTGQLMSLITNDVNSFRMAIGPGMLILFDAAFYIVLILPLMISINPDWTWKTLILLPLVPFLIRKMETIIHERFRIQQDRLSEVSARAQEIVSGIRVIKSFAQERNQSKDFNDHSRRFEQSCNRVAVADAAFHPMMESVVAFGTVSLLWFGSDNVIRNEVTLGTFVAFHEYVRRMVWPMSAIGMGFSMFEQGKASYSRIRDLLEHETDIPDAGTRSIDRFQKLEIRNLSFSYGDSNNDGESNNYTLQDINLTIHAGETIGVVGPIGAGKTTLLNLITRLYKCKTGEILINGIDLKEITRESLSGTISYVTQDAFLFSDTITENVALGLSELPGIEHIESATAMVNLNHEIREIPGSYDALLGERGVNLSGGQKQRLTIARALIRDSQIVILDDSLSAVDGRTEKAITAELQTRATSPNKPHEQTVILVSHRLATLKHADRIIVLNRGRVEAVGTHSELIASSETYRELDRLQSAPPPRVLAPNHWPQEKISELE